MDFTLVLEPAPEAAKAARDLVAEAFGKWGLESYEARLVITELFSNAARVSGEPVVVRVGRARGKVLLEVWDQSDEPLVLRAAGPEEEGGRGLFIIDDLVAEWGVRPLDGGGKAVWAVMA
ncbi:ATP-binding protein [Spirillospora sp. NPDC048911]|uniref:ATP-binding protein n=1 Tax=Spirillospora sp. NPDC048911 TaxID=3364527 RepID=UPI003712902C